VPFKKGQKYVIEYHMHWDSVAGNYRLIPSYAVAKQNIKKKQKTWIGELIEHYKFVDGKDLGEKNPKWLQDDYVKFIRFAQWKIEQAGGGIIGLITNHSYLDNPTFRGMRQSLMKSFDEIHILDLHGNSLKKERCPDGSKDENVFDIQQGVAIALFVKKKGAKNEPKVFHSESWGLREIKYDWLEKNDIKTTIWKRITPKSEFHLFVPREEKLLALYDKYPKITEVFPINSVGVVTSRDSFVIDSDKEALKRRIGRFIDEKMPDEVIRQELGLNDKPNWKLKEVRKKVRKDEDRENSITQILYRPFDTQWILYHDEVIERSRKEVMRHMLQKNIGLCVGRAGQVVGLEKPWNIVFLSEHIMDFNMFYRGGELLFPLYVYPDTDKRDLFSHTRKHEKKKPNIKPEILQALTDFYKKEPEPQEIFHYVYAVLYANTYRTKYAEFLKIDFPRIPFTKDYGLFKKMGEYGKELVDLHLLRFEDKTIAKFQGKNGNVVEKLKYDEKQRRVYINKDQYFEGVPNEVWEYQIGGYQVSEKWLKDRKTRRLSVEEIKKYCQIVTALQRTIEVQKEIDKIYPEVEKDVVTMKK